MNIFLSALDLFRPIWRKKNIDHVIHVAKATDDQRLLSKIARHSPDRIIRAMACEKILDQHILVEIAMFDTEEHVRETAIERITDEDILIELALRTFEPRAAALAVRQLKEIGNLSYFTHGFAEKVRKIPYRSHNLLMLAIANEEHFPGICKVIVGILKEQHGRESTFFKEISVENLDQEDARVMLIQLSVQTNAWLEAKKPSKWTDGASKPRSARLLDFCFSEAGLLIYVGIAAIVYGVYCKIVGVAFVTFRRLTPASAAEIVLIAGLCVPVALWLFFVWRRYRHGQE